MDGLRGVLAAYVLLGPDLPFTGLPGWATSPFRHGEAAVDLFFALSGLVIVQSLERFGGKFRPFMAARARRLLPVYFVVLALSVMLLTLGDPLRSMPGVGPAWGCRPRSAGMFWRMFCWHRASCRKACCPMPMSPCWGRPGASLRSGNSTCSSASSHPGGWARLRSPCSAWVRRIMCWNY